MPELDKNQKRAENAVVTPKTIDAFSAFFATLKDIHIQLIAEGYIIRDGKIIKPERLLAYDQTSKPPRKNRR